jgi:hypothetical protein
MFEIRSNSDCLLLKTKKSDFSHGNCAYVCVSLWEIFISERIQFFHSLKHSFILSFINFFVLRKCTYWNVSFWKIFVLVNFQLIHSLQPFIYAFIR